MSDLDALRALVREVIRDVLPHGLPETETVDLSTDEDLAAFVRRLLDVEPGEREELRSGRKRFMLAAPRPASAGETPAVRRIERGAVTEAVVSAAARAGQRLVLGRGAVLTPLARDRARASGVQIEKER
ncbi:MAG TPA: hypothetical protein VGU21_03120 [Streptosporangiaceae bacterium]|nr:hypothetical protein [Streptosporangiaceae bacterium]